MKSVSGYHRSKILVAAVALNIILAVVAGGVEGAASHRSASCLDLGARELMTRALARLVVTKDPSLRPYINSISPPFSTDLDGLNLPQLVAVKLSNGVDYTFTLTEVLHSIVLLCPAPLPLAATTIRPPSSVTTITTIKPTPMTTTSSERQASPTPPTSAASTASSTATPPSTPSPPHTTSATTEAQAGSASSSPDFKLACLDYLAEVASTDSAEKGAGTGFSSLFVKKLLEPHCPAQTPVSAQQPLIVNNEAPTPVVQGDPEEDIVQDLFSRLGGPTLHGFVALAMVYLGSLVDTLLNMLPGYRAQVAGYNNGNGLCWTLLHVVCRTLSFSKNMAVNGKGEYVTPHDISVLRSVNRLSELDINADSLKVLTEALLGVNDGDKTTESNLESILIQQPRGSSTPAVPQGFRMRNR